jgi:hypothetical protein
MHTLKLTLRKRRRSPKYKSFGFHRTTSGFRFDGPYFSVAAFLRGSVSYRDHLMVLIENNRNRQTRVYTL